MSRGKNIGGLSEETKDRFKIAEIKGKWANHEVLMSRMITLYEEFNDIYEQHLAEQESSAQ